MISPVSLHITTAVMQAPVGWDGALKVTDASATLDEGWAPYCQVDMTITTPDGVLIEQLDPRGNVRITVTVTQVWVYPVRSPQTRTFDLVLRERELNHETGETRIKLESDEAYLIDAALVAMTNSTSLVAGANSLRYVVNTVLSNFSMGLEAGTTDHSFSASPEALIHQPGVSYWDFLQPLVQTAGLRLFCDERRVWRLVKPVDFTIDQQINVAATVNLTHGRDLISRYGDYYDSVVVKYTGGPDTFYDSAGTVVSTGGVSVPFSIPFALIQATLTGGKTMLVEWDRPYPGAGAAKALLERAKGRGRRLSLDALSNYDATPGMTLVATVPNTPIQTGTISSVTWRWAAMGSGDEMTIGSRGLIDTATDSWLLADETLTWEGVPDDVLWNTYTH